MNYLSCLSYIHHSNLSLIKSFFNMERKLMFSKFFFIFFNFLMISSLSFAQTKSSDLVAGKTKFDQICATCHGATGKGDGAASAALNPKPRNFQDVAYMSKRTDDQLRKVIQEGGAANGMSAVMPSWKAVLNEQDITNIIGYIRQLGKSPSK